MERVERLHLSPPNEKQKLFLQCRKKYIAFGGARGGGKSWAVRTKAKLMALRYPGIRMLLVRRTYQELENNHIRFLRRQTPHTYRYTTEIRMQKHRLRMLRRPSKFFS